MFTLVEDIKTVEDVMDSSTETLYYAYKYYNEGKIDFSDEVVDEICKMLVMSGM